MTLIATSVAILNMGAGLLETPAWARLVMIALNLVFVAIGVSVGEPLIWAPHIALIALNSGLLIGALDRGARD